MVTPVNCNQCYDGEKGVYFFFLPPHDVTIIARSKKGPSFLFYKSIVFIGMKIPDPHSNKLKYSVDNMQY